MAAVRVFDGLFGNTAAAAAAAAAVNDLATLEEVQRHNRDDEADEGSPRAKRTLCSRRRRDKDVFEHCKQLNADLLEPASRT